jgi:mercuric ion transport protein
MDWISARKVRPDMDASRSGTASITPIAANLTAPEREEVRRQRLLAVGGILGALAASSCCIVPLVLFSLGVSGAWIGNLTALAPYQPIFVAVTVAILGYGFYLVYWKPNEACAEDGACARPLPNRIVKLGLWSATALVTAAFSFNYVAPLLLRA